MKKALNELNLSPSAVEGFLRLYEKYKQGPAKIADWETVRSPDQETLLRYESLTEPDEDVFRVELTRLAVCKLNGGLGTSMGCEDPKSSIVVRGGKTFLDLIRSFFSKQSILYPVYHFEISGNRGFERY